MEKQEKIAWLERYRLTLAEERRLTEEMAEVRARAEGVTRLLQRACVQGGQRTDRMAAGVEKLEELGRRLEEQVVRGVEVRAEVERAIAGIEDERLEHMMRLRYVNGHGWEKIGEEMYLDSRWVRRLHVRALEKMEVKGK